MLPYIAKCPAWVESWTIAHNPNLFSLKFLYVRLNQERIWNNLFAPAWKIYKAVSFKGR